MYKEKSRLRSEVIRKRDAIPLEVKKAKDRMIRERLSGLGEYRNAGTVMLFASFRTEVDTIPIIRDALMQGKRVVLPKVDSAKKELGLYNIRSVDELIPGFLGIPEPGVVEGRKVAPEELELIVMPGVAFDERGGRLGYGGGYYDRLGAGLRHRPPLVAVAYEEQVISEVPVADHDIRVDKIVTDRRVIEVRDAGA